DPQAVPVRRQVDWSSRIIEGRGGPGPVGVDRAVREEGRAGRTRAESAEDESPPGWTPGRLRGADAPRGHRRRAGDLSGRGLVTVNAVADRREVSWIRAERVRRGPPRLGADRMRLRHVVAALRGEIGLLEASPDQVASPRAGRGRGLRLPRLEVKPRVRRCDVAELPGAEHLELDIARRRARVGAIEEDGRHMPAAL